MKIVPIMASCWAWKNAGLSVKVGSRLPKIKLIGKTTVEPLPWGPRWVARVENLWRRRRGEREFLKCSPEYGDDPSSAFESLWQFLTAPDADLIIAKDWEEAQKPAPRRRWDGTTFRKYPPLKAKKENA